MKYFLVLARLAGGAGFRLGANEPSGNRDRQNRQRNADDQVLRSVGARTANLWRGWTGDAGSNRSDLARRGK